MRTTLIRTQSRAEINALAYQGIRPSECYPQLRDTILRNFDEEHANLLAEPVSSTTEGCIDWYVPIEGNVTRYRALDSGEQEKASARFRALASDILARAEELMLSSDAQKVTRGHLLKLAMRYPSDDDLFLVGNQVVATCWGFGPGTSGAQSAILCDLRVLEQAEPEKTTTPTPPLAKESNGCLPWLLPLLLLSLLFCLLFADFGSVRALSGLSLFRLPALFGEEVSLKDLEGRSATLLEERNGLESAVFAHLAQCRLPERLRTATVHEENSKEGQKEEQLEELDIPSNVVDTSFLRGRWLCATGLFNSKTQEPVQVEFVFDSSGEGVGTIFEKQDVCTGKAKAALDGENLTITHEALLCQASKGQFSPNVIHCAKNALGKTECRGENSDGIPWNAVFLKVREP